MSLGESERAMLGRIALRPNIPAHEMVAIVADALLKLDTALRKLEHRVNDAERLAGRAFDAPEL